MSDFQQWQGRPAPALSTVAGRYARLAPAVFPDDGAKLFSALCGAGNEDLWTYIPLGPFDSANALGAAMAAAGAQQNWQTHLFFAPKSDAAIGMASYMRIRPEAGSAEVGCIVMSKKLQKTRAATEAMYLMARHIFDDLGYRRYEWKCNDANEASKRAALRYGFKFEGVFRNDMVIKGKNRDTAWFSIIDREWPVVKAAFETWLSPENFDESGRQRRSLARIREDG